MHLLVVYSSMILGWIFRIVQPPPQFSFRAFPSPKGTPPARSQLLFIPAPGNPSSPFCLYRAASPGHFIHTGSYKCVCSWLLSLSMHLWGYSTLQHGTVCCPFLLLNSVPLLCRSSTDCLFIPQLMGLWVVLTFWPSWIMLLRTFTSKSLHGHMFLFLLGES